MPRGGKPNLVAAVSVCDQFVPRPLVEPFANPWSLRKPSGFQSHQPLNGYRSFIRLHNGEKLRWRF